MSEISGFGGWNWPSPSDLFGWYWLDADRPYAYINSKFACHCNNVRLNWEVPATVLPSKVTQLWPLQLWLKILKFEVRLTFLLSVRISVCQTLLQREFLFLPDVLPGQFQILRYPWCLCALCWRCWLWQLLCVIRELQSPMCRLRWWKKRSRQLKTRRQMGSFATCVACLQLMLFEVFCGHWSGEGTQWNQWTSKQIN